jgi:L-ascorbate metabolism protein UlaG (beta-lactamase superfamily)
VTGERHGSIRATWLGHASVLLEDGAVVLTDPVLTHRVVHLHRRAGGTPRVPTPAPDIVVVSHLHADHLHLPSLRLLAQGTVVLVPRGAAPLLRRLPLDVVEVAAGDTVTVQGTAVTAVPARHSGTRWPWARLRCAALGYLVEGNGAAYFAGDTVAFPDMAALHPALDLALLPVGGWGPWLRGEHLDPRAAADCLRLLRPRVALPIHYGTLWPSGMGWVRPSAFHDPGHRFAEHARRTAPDVDVRVLAPGASTEVGCGAGRSGS